MSQTGVVLGGTPLRTLRTPGTLPPGKFLEGRVIVVNERVLQTTPQTQAATAPTQKGTATGKSSQKKGKGKKGKGKGSYSDTVLEIYLCAGTTAGGCRRSEPCG